MKRAWGLGPGAWGLGVLVALCFTAEPARTQDRGAAALGSALQGLGVNTRVLMIGAHPDDEDTQVIAWLSRGRHVETAYLSLTRGDGGQNIIGNELGEGLGVIRTEELLAARRIDAARQYFTRAYDYGFSKNAQEAFTQWPHDSLLLDVMTVVRAFKPHVIIAVFTGTPRDGHGQHQAAGILAREAYDLSADTVRFPRSATAGYGAWSATKFYRGVFNRDSATTIRFNVGEYDPVLGRSYAEIAAISRSQHRSQAFGSLQPLGVRMDGLQREATRAPAPEGARTERGVFDGMDTTWARFRNEVEGAEARAALDSLPAAFAAARTFDVFEPASSIPRLGRVKALLDRVCPPQRGLPLCGRAGAGRPQPTDVGVAVAIALGRVSDALVLATGVAVEATVPRELWGVGKAIPVRPRLYNRGTRPVTILQADLQFANVNNRTGGTAPIVVAPDSSAIAHDFVGDGFGYRFDDVTVPRWLIRPRKGAMFDYPIRGSDEASEARNASVDLQLSVDGIGFSVRAPIVYRFADQVLGEIRRPIAAVPVVSVLLDQPLSYAPARTPIEREVNVYLQSPDSVAHQVRLEVRLPQGLVADTAVRTVVVPKAGTSQVVRVRVRGQLPVGTHQINVVATEGDATYARGYTTIDYEHINARRVYRPSRMSVEAVDVAAVSGMRVGYIAGVSDNSAAALEQLGIDVTQIDPATLANANLRGYSAIVIGPRAYETQPALVTNNARVLDYARNGGTLVVQYGQYEMQQPGIMPFPITINRPHDRVTDENAPVTILDSTAAILRAPNRITTSDFNGWLQDRSLYMPRTFDSTYTPILAMNDPGEQPNRGALLIAPLGQGTYVYTTLAFFRQLPNGVPGAARLFVNLLAAKAGRTAQ